MRWHRVGTALLLICAAGSVPAAIVASSSTLWTPAAATPPPDIPNRQGAVHNVTLANRATVTVMYTYTTNDTAFTSVAAPKRIDVLKTTAATAIHEWAEQYTTTTLRHNASTLDTRVTTQYGTITIMAITSGPEANASPSTWRVHDGPITVTSPAGDETEHIVATDTLGNAGTLALITVLAIGLYGMSTER